MAAEYKGGQHNAFLVEDLASAVRSWTDALGTPFGEARTESMGLSGDAGDFTEDVTFQYSLDRTIELIQAGGSGLFASSELGYHHFGGFSATPLEQGVEEQVRLGAEVEWRLTMNGTLFAVFFSAQPKRPRLELLSPHLLQLTES